MKSALTDYVFIADFLFLPGKPHFHSFLVLLRGTRAAGKKFSFTLIFSHSAKSQFFVAMTKAVGYFSKKFILDRNFFKKSSSNTY